MWRSSETDALVPTFFMSVLKDWFARAEEMRRYAASSTLNYSNLEYGTTCGEKTLKGGIKGAHYDEETFRSTRKRIDCKHKMQITSTCIASPHWGALKQTEGGCECHHAALVHVGTLKLFGGDSALC